MVEIATQDQTSSPGDDYRLSAEQLRMPVDSGRERLEWLYDLMKLQQEGIRVGIRPHMPTNLPRNDGTMLRMWRSRVWNMYLKSYYGERYIIGDLQGNQYHTNSNIERLDQV